MILVAVVLPSSRASVDALSFKHGTFGKNRVRADIAMSSTTLFYHHGTIMKRTLMMDF
jgi:hypothetical protein